MDYRVNSSLEWTWCYHYLRSRQRGGGRFGGLRGCCCIGRVEGVQPNIIQAMFSLSRPFIWLSLAGAGILTFCVVAQSTSSLSFISLQKPEAYTILSEAVKVFAARDETRTVSIVGFTHLPNPDLFRSCLLESDESGNWHSRERVYQGDRAQVQHSAQI